MKALQSAVRSRFQWKNLSQKGQIPAKINRIMYARVLEQVDNSFEEALKAANTAIELEPESTEGWLTLGNISSKGGKVSEAEDAFRRAIAINSGSARLWYYFGKALEVDPDGVAAMTGLAQLSLENDVDIGLAESLITKAISIRPRDPQVLLARAFLKRHQNAINECLDDLRSALDEEADFVEAKVVLASVEAQHVDFCGDLTFLR